MKSVSISIVKGKGSLKHNNREFITNNVDEKKITNNIIYKKESLYSAYENCFAAAIDQYNLKQKRNDRKINGVEGYIEKIRNSKNGEKLFYENIVQVGNMQDSRVGTKQGEIAKEILNKYMINFERRNPNLYVLNAVLHLDEQTPHLHIDYIPIANGYVKGLNIRNSLDRAFKQQGIDGKANKFSNRTIAWQNLEKEYIENILKEYDLTRSEEKGFNRKNKSVEEYKTIIEHTEKELNSVSADIVVKPTLLSKSKVIIDNEDLKKVEKTKKAAKIQVRTSKKLIKEEQTIISELNKKLKDASDAEKKYRELYNKQLNLNDEVEELKIICAEKNEIINSLTSKLNENEKIVKVVKADPEFEKIVNYKIENNNIEKPSVRNQLRINKIKNNHEL